MPRFLLPLALAFFVALPAHAELKGIYQLPKEKTLTLSVRDDRHMLAAVDDDKRLLLKGADTWVLKRQSDHWLALNANNAGGLLAALQKKHDTKLPDGPLELRPLNRKETVAGYVGDVYELSDGEKKYEVVLTDNAEVVALTNAWRTMAKRVAEHLDQRNIERLQQALAAIPSKGKGGLLRQGDNLKLAGVEKKVSAAEFELPANAQMLSLPDM